MSEKSQVKKYCILGMCQNGGLAPDRIHMDWAIRYTLKHPKQLRHPLISPRWSETPLGGVSSTPKSNIHTYRYIRRFLNIPQRVSVGVCLCPFIFGNIRGHLGYLETFQGVLAARRCSRVFRRAQPMWDSVWPEPTHHFGTSLNATFFHLTLSGYQNI